MIDIEKAKTYFKKYVWNYDMDDPRINLKVSHMEYVAENARKIAERLGLSQEGQNLAELIGLLHDIGRLEQWRLYSTYSDKLSVDHGQKSAQVLFADKEIRNFIEDEKYDAIIYKAVNNHNKLAIEKGLSEEELLYSKIVRDADNIDIFRGLVNHKIENYTHFGSLDVSAEILSEAFFEDFKKEEILLYGNAKTDMDIMVAIIAHIYAVNFAESLKIIKENDYINRFVQKINAKDEFTREKLNEIADYAMDYIERKIEN